MGPAPPQLAEEVGPRGGQSHLVAHIACYAMGFVGRKKQQNLQARSTSGGEDYVFCV